MTTKRPSVEAGFSAGVRLCLALTLGLFITCPTHAATGGQVERPVSAAKGPVKVIQARVVGITDGDTIVMEEGQHRPFVVRVEGIDCPDGGQPFVGVASRFTRSQACCRVVDLNPLSID